jgi:hypothetical protein
MVRWFLSNPNTIACSKTLYTEFCFQNLICTVYGLRAARSWTPTHPCYLLMQSIFRSYINSKNLTVQVKHHGDHLFKPLSKISPGWSVTLGR